LGCPKKSLECFAMLESFIIINLFLKII